MSVYALSDLHGNLNIWKKIKEFLKPEDKVYFLGDAADRGDYGWEIIKEIIKHIVIITINMIIMKEISIILIWDLIYIKE